MIGRAFFGQSRWPQFLFIWLVSTLVCFFIYRYGWIDFPRADHVLGFLPEADRFSDPWEYLKNVISYNRTRTLHPGDVALFRPLTHLWLGLIEVLGRTNLYFKGLVSLALHGALSASLFVWSRKRLPLGLSIGAALFFAAQFSGLEMILWRHISPYMASVFFLFLGLDLRTTRPVLGVVLICFAMGFHEAAAGAVACVVIRDWISLRRIDRLFVMVLSLWAALNAFDYFLHAPYLRSSVFSEAPTMWRGVYLTLALAGAQLIAFFAPWVVQFEFVFERLAWSYAPAIGLAMFLLGVSVLLVTWTPVQIGVRARRLVLGLQDAEFGILSFVAIVLFLVGFGRGGARGIEYLHVCSYVFYFGNFLGALLLVRGMAHLPRTSRVLGAITGALVLMAGVSAWKIDRTLKPFFPAWEKAARMAMVLRESKPGSGGCLNRVWSAEETQLRLPVLFGNQMCKTQQPTDPAAVSP